MKQELKPAFIEVSAAVRYWEDAKINGEEDLDGTLTPFREGDLWKPVIRICDGLVVNWPEGMAASFHFKVCDAGEYWIQDESGKRIAKYSGYYVPNGLCHGDIGYGDYIIFNVFPDGEILKYRKPEITLCHDCDDDGEGPQWVIINDEPSGGAA